ncbi:CPBP family intramembrane glutamic endopeptidase [Jannaschia seohaensis]|uniref:CAAX prenyl protease 2/Lysostaphin resistance protein A-like domain-containing protein n=1 Tax=Jannaschia seohaensis TaxID=475081 RepID=A0A2Y9A2C5_9RHOB|nr:CPBP family intramembrane glutamic endopeptidase [Jannaschia seohaensis]PWJ22147.1 hypothetical protein BCF38_101556 [Jannaschia seohaensis]SSA38425.1 hypothetical protein SAMN05421539_101556 [Jannaschia seohaensis]
MNTERRLLPFFLLTFALSWVVFIPPFLDWIGVPTPIGGPGYNGFANFISTFGPLFAAVILLWRDGGWRSALGLLKSGFDFRIRPLLLGAAILLPVATAWVASSLVSATGIDTLPGSMVPQDLGYPAAIWLVPAFLSMMVFGGGQEEFGWRGYAQRPMQTALGFAGSALALGAIWGLWHLPLWIVPGDPHVYIPFPVFVVFTMAFSVQMLWLFQLSGYKLAVPWIMHGVQNTVLIVFPVYRLDAAGPQTGLFVYVGLNILVAGLILLASARDRRGA